MIFLEKGLIILIRKSAWGLRNIGSYTPESIHMQKRCYMWIRSWAYIYTEIIVLFEIVIAENFDNLSGLDALTNNFSKTSVSSSWDQRTSLGRSWRLGLFSSRQRYLSFTFVFPCKDCIGKYTGQLFSKVNGRSSCRLGADLSTSSIRKVI